MYMLHVTLHSGIGHLISEITIHGISNCVLVHVNILCTGLHDVHVGNNLLYSPGFFFE